MSELTKKQQDLLETIMKKNPQRNVQHPYYQKKTDQLIQKTKLLINLKAIREMITSR